MKRKDKKLYEKKITLGRNASGVTVRKSIYAKTKVELERKAFEARQEWLETAPAFDTEQIGFVAYCRRWLFLEKSDKGIRTREMYENLINSYIEPRFHDILISEITQTDLLEFIQRHSDRPNTASKLKIMLRQVYSSAEDAGLIPFGKIRIEKLPTYKAKPAEKRALTDVERDALFAADLTEKERCFVLTLFYTGLRREEALALTSGAFDFEKKTVKVSQVLIKDGSKVVISPSAKTIGSLRSVPLPDAYLVQCQKYIRSCKGFIFGMDRKEGEPMTASSFVKFWKRIREKLSAICPSAIELTPHMFRHNYATMLYYSNISLKMAAKLLGHKDTAMIMRVYAHLDEQKENTTEKLNMVFGI